MPRRRGLSALGWSYTEDDDSDDPLGGYEDLAFSAKCSARTFGNDVCNGSNCSWCEIEFGYFQVTAVEAHRSASTSASCTRL